MENDKTMQELLDAYEGGFKAPRRGEVIEGKVVMVNDYEVVVNVGYKSDGIIPKDEVNGADQKALTEMFEEGQELDVYVLKTDNGDGNVLLSTKRLVVDQDFKDLEPIYESGESISIVVKQIVKGGVIAYYKNVRGFIPASHLSLRYEKDTNKYLGQTMDVKVIEYDKRKKRAVFSRKEILRVEQSEKREQFFNNIEEGQTIDGVVKRLANFGAFVDIGGFDGLVHISEITYGRIKSPSEFLKPNQEVKVKVLRIDKEKEKISLSIKKTKPNPWDEAAVKYSVGSTHVGRVVNMTDFGAFVELEPGVEGLVHISQISLERIEKPSDILTENRSYEFEVLEIDTIEKKIKLSRKALLDPEATVPMSSEALEEETSADYQPETENEAVAETVEAAEETVEAAEEATEATEEAAEVAEETAEAAEEAAEVAEETVEAAEEAVETTEEAVEPAAAEEETEA